MSLVKTSDVVRPPLNDSALVRALSEIAGISDLEGKRHFVLKWASLIDLADSIVLSNAHASMKTLTVNDGKLHDQALEAVAAEYIGARQAMITSIKKSFSVSDAPARIKLPFAKANAAYETATSFEPYHKFYAIHQRDMDIRVQRLHTRIRAMLTEISTELARLVELDIAIGETLAPFSRKQWLLVPQVLARRFQQLKNTQELKASEQGEPSLQQITSDNGWLGVFCQQMRVLLLAELELRMQPTLGLLDALKQRSTQKR